jgi:4-amino-4-deoxy-L-arabinose transferase-like glycosyltransferase
MRSRPEKQHEKQPQLDLPTTDIFTLREIVLLAAVFILGVAARLFFLSHATVEHFDEGVYASNIYFGPPDYAYPQQRLYAPPLLPALIEAGMIAGLPPNLAALLPGFLAGCGTIVAVWWFGRSWFGAEVGLAAASLVALNDFHLTFSATALTDVLLGLWLVLSVDAIGRSLAGRDYRWAIGAGIYTGLAWWTKYNGWLPLAIEAAALPLLWFFLRPPRRDLVAWLGCLAVTCLVAVAVWSPYYLSLQFPGGYGPIAENHARYVVGFAGWPRSALVQISNQLAIGGGWTLLGVFLSFLSAQLLKPRRPLEVLVVIFRSLLGTIGCLLVTGGFLIAVGAALGIVRVTMAIHRAGRWDAVWISRAIALALIATWGGAMLVATPLYTPYARLALPIVVASWLAAALNVAGMFGPILEQPAEPEGGRGCGCLFVIGFVFLASINVAVAPHEDHWNRTVDRRGLIEIAQLVRMTERSSGQPRVIYVYGEPALFFQLRAAGEQNVSPVQLVPSEPATLEGRPIPTFLITGPHANRDRKFQQQWADVKESWQLVHEYEYQPSDVVWLDLNHPQKSPKDTRVLDRVRLYRLREGR